MKDLFAGAQVSPDISELPVTIDSMTEEELNAKLQHSYEQSLLNQGRPYAVVFDEIERSFK